MHKNVLWKLFKGAPTEDGSAPLRHAKGFGLLGQWLVTPILISLVGFSPALASGFANCYSMGSVLPSTTARQTSSSASGSHSLSAVSSHSLSLSCSLCLSSPRIVNTLWCWLPRTWGRGAGIRGKRAPGAARLLLASASPLDPASAGLCPGRRAARPG